MDRGDLTEYARKRDFRKTPEPWEGSGVGTAVPPFERFVVQEHHSRRLHWDLRLEMDGVLKSWAVPKGIPLVKGIPRLAVEVEDHPLSYIDFEGEIPPGNYGAGTVSIWDHGRYALATRTPDKIVLVVLGRRLSGGYKLKRTSGKQWLLLKTVDENQRGDAAP